MDGCEGAPQAKGLRLEPGRFLGPPARPVAVVDIGSNSVRLVVYDRLSRAPFPRFNEKALCRLGARREADGRIEAAALDHALRTLERFFAISRAMGVERIDVLATEAVRDAPNGHVLTDGIRARCGAEVRLLPGAEEARISAAGVASGFAGASGLMGDIGGGSLEIAPLPGDATGAEPLSLPLGALPVAAWLKDGRKAAKARVDAALAEAPLPSAPVLYMVGGGWRALAKVEIARSRPPVRVVHGFEMAAKAARKLAKRIAKSDPATLADVPGVPSRRAATLPAAALVLERVLKAMKPERVVVSALGLREGWLHTLLPEAEQARDPLLEGAQAFGTPRARVPDFGPALVRWTDALVPDETAAERRLRLAAIALSDVAWRDAPNNRGQVIFGRMLELPFTGLTHAERMFLAATLMARHGMRPEGETAEAVRAVLPEAARDRANVLGRAMQLGYRISGSVPEILDRARLVPGEDRVEVRIDGAATVPDSDTVQTRLGQLAKAMGVAEARLTVE